MKHSAVVVVARPALISFLPGKKVLPRKLRVTLWQTHSWIKKIIKPRKRSRIQRGTQTMRRWFHVNKKTKACD
jgi:hypothetical protein